jgi:hypothetical protein
MKANAHYVDMHAVIEGNKNRILDKLETLYKELERPHITEAWREHVEREIRLYEKEFDAWDTKGYCTIEDLF